MQNKPNLLDAQMNVRPVKTMAYENETAFRLRKNKPNSSPNKPNQTQFQKGRLCCANIFKRFVLAHFISQS